MEKIIHHLLFHHAQEKTLQGIDNILSRDLIVLKNNEVYDYDKFLAYGEDFVSSEANVRIKDYAILLQESNTIAVKFIMEKIMDGFTKAEKYISIFTFKNNKITRIEELCIEL